jgi:hypothetical protein
MLVLASENKAEIEKIVADLIRGLKREATPGEIIEAELVAVACVRARRLRSNGKSDSHERQLLAALMQTTVFGSQPEPSPAERQHGAEVAEAYDRHNAATARAASREPWVKDGVKAGEPAPDTDERGAENV